MENMQNVTAALDALGVETCLACGKAGAKSLCIGCRSVSFCGKACQEVAWPGHKEACRRIALEAENERLRAEVARLTAETERIEAEHERSEAEHERELRVVLERMEALERRTTDPIAAAFAADEAIAAGAFRPVQSKFSRPISFEAPPRRASRGGR